MATSTSSKIARATLTVMRRALNAGINLEELLILAQLPKHRLKVKGSKGGDIQGRVICHLKNNEMIDLTEAGMYIRLPAGDQLFAMPGEVTA